MFRATLNDKTFFDDTTQEEAFQLLSPKLRLEVGKSGSFSFDMLPSNIAYEDIALFKSIIKVYRKNRLIFAGRVLSYSLDFNNIKTVEVEGLLSLFCDSIQRPFAFNGSINEFVSFIVKRHNEQVDESKQFAVGQISVTDSNDYIARSREGYVSSMELLKDTADTLGGYFVARAEANGYFLDFLADFTAEAVQHIDFGENLLDVERELLSEELITALIPLGAEIEMEPAQVVAEPESEEEAEEIQKREKLTITSVNGGSDTLIDAEAVKKYGLIVGVKEWKDVTRPENLKAKGEAYLKLKSQGETAINITALDLAEAGNDVAGLLCGEYVHIYSKPHQIDEKMLIKAQDIPLDDITQTSIKVGSVSLGFLEYNAKHDANLNQTVEKIEANYTTNETVGTSLEELKTTLSSEILQNAENIRLEVKKEYATSDSLNAIKTEIDQRADRIEQSVTDLDGIRTSVSVTKDGIIIGKSDSEIKSVQDNKSYKFVDKAGQTLLELNAKGVNTPAINVAKQIKVGDSWAIRHGDYTKEGYNLNDVWIG